MNNAGKPERNTGLGPSRQEGAMQQQAGKIRYRITKLTAMCALLLAVACSAVYQNHGFVPSEDDLALIKVGRDNREAVARIVGRPSASALLNETGWYYVQSRWKHSGALPPKEEDRQVVAITFDKSGVVENIERFGLEKGQVVPLSRRVTDSNIKGIGFLRQLLGNFGNFRASDFLKK